MHLVVQCLVDRVEKSLPWVTVSCLLSEVITAGGVMRINLGRGLTLRRTLSVVGLALCFWRCPHGRRRHFVPAMAGSGSSAPSWVSNKGGGGIPNKGGGGKSEGFNPESWVITCQTLLRDHFAELHSELSAANIKTGRVKVKRYDVINNEDEKFADHRLSIAVLAMLVKGLVRRDGEKTAAMLTILQGLEQARREKQWQKQAAYRGFLPMLKLSEGKNELKDLLTYTQAVWEYADTTSKNEREELQAVVANLLQDVRDDTSKHDIETYRASLMYFLWRCKGYAGELEVYRNFCKAKELPAALLVKGAPWQSQTESVNESSLVLEKKSLWQHITSAERLTGVAQVVPSDAKGADSLIDNWLVSIKKDQLGANKENKEGALGSAREGSIRKSPSKVTKKALQSHPADALAGEESIRKSPLNMTEQAWQAPPSDVSARELGPYDPLVDEYKEGSDSEFFDDSEENLESTDSG